MNIMIRSFYYLLFVKLLHRVLTCFTPECQRPDFYPISFWPNGIPQINISTHSGISVGQNVELYCSLINRCIDTTNALPCEYEVVWRRIADCPNSWAPTKNNEHLQSSGVFGERLHIRNVQEYDNGLWACDLHAMQDGLTQSVTIQAFMLHVVSNRNDRGFLKCSNIATQPTQCRESEICSSQWMSEVSGAIKPTESRPYGCVNVRQMPPRVFTVMGVDSRRTCDRLRHTNHCTAESAHELGNTSDFQNSISHCCYCFSDMCNTNPIAVSDRFDDLGQWIFDITHPENDSTCKQLARWQREASSATKLCTVITMLFALFILFTIIV